MVHVKICCIQSIREAELALRHGAYAIGLVSSMPTGTGVIGDAEIRDIAATEVAAIRTEAARAIRWVQRGHPAIDDCWRHWMPPDAWATPQLSPGWDAVS